MVVQAEQQRLRKLIKDTLTMLCRNGLSFDEEFSIEALIGITLDKNDVFLVNINEKIESGDGALRLECEKVPSTVAGDQTSESPNRKRRKRKHKKSKPDATTDLPLSADEFSDDHDIPEKIIIARPPLISDAPVEAESKDILLVKQEVLDSWGDDAEPLDDPSDLLDQTNSLLETTQDTSIEWNVSEVTDAVAGTSQSGMQTPADYTTCYTVCDHLTNSYADQLQAFWHDSFTCSKLVKLYKYGDVAGCSEVSRNRLMPPAGEAIGKNVTNCLKLWHQLLKEYRAFVHDYGCHKNKYTNKSALLWMTITSKLGLGNIKMLNQRKLVFQREASLENDVVEKIRSAINQ